MFVRPPSTPVPAGRFPAGIFLVVTCPPGLSPPGEGTSFGPSCGSGGDPAVRVSTVDRWIKSPSKKGTMLGLTVSAATGLYKVHGHGRPLIGRNTSLIRGWGLVIGVRPGILGGLGCGFPELGWVLQLRQQAGLVDEGAAALAPASIHPVWRASGGVISYELYVTNHLYYEAVVFQITIHINTEKNKEKTKFTRENFLRKHIRKIIAQSLLDMIKRFLRT